MALRDDFATQILDEENRQGSVRCGKNQNRRTIKQSRIYNPMQLETAKKKLQKNGGRLSSILRQLDYIDENTVIKFLSRQHNYPSVIIKNEPPSKDALKLLPYETPKSIWPFPCGWPATPCRSPWPNPPIDGGGGAAGSRQQRTLRLRFHRKGYRRGISEILRHQR